MVLKPRPLERDHKLGFENDVEMYGAQTKRFTETVSLRFENDVEMYGAQTVEAMLLSLH